MTEWIISSSVLIVIISALRHILRGRISLRLQYALWALVLLRLLIPVSLGSSALSVMNALPADVPAAVLSVGVPDGAYTSGFDTAVAVPAIPDAETQTDTVTMYNDVGAVTQDHANVTDWGAALKGVWFAGAGAVGIWLLVCNLRFGATLRRARREYTPQCASRLPVYVTDAAETPCLFGLLRPAIYLTPEAAEDTVKARHVMAHEATHYRHGDHIWALLRGVCLALHWYNPLVWWAASLSRRDAELACDEGAISLLGEDERAGYGRTLINLTCQKRAALLLTATTMTGGKSSIRERITLIARKPKTAIYTLIAVILIAAVAAGCTFTGASEKPVETGETAAVSIYTEGSFDVPEDVLHYALDYTQSQLSYYTDELGYEITEAKITGLTPIDFAPTSDVTVGLWLLEYRFLAANQDEIMLVGSMKMDGDYITEWGSTGQPYLILNRTGDDTYERICVTNTLTMQEDYNTPEMLEQYGSMYAAAAMELYNSYLRNNNDTVKISRQITDVLNSDGAYASMALDALLDSLMDSPAETFEAIGTRSEGIQNWICWSLANYIDGMALDTSDALTVDGLSESADFARELLWKYMSGDYEAPKSWRQIYLDFWRDELSELLDGAQIDGVGLLDTDADGVAELVVIIDGSAVLYYTDGQSVYRNIGSTYDANELDFSGSLLSAADGDSIDAESFNALLNGWRPIT